MPESLAMKKSLTLTLLGLSCVGAFAEAPAPYLSVNGILTLFGDRRVIFKICPAGGGEHSCILAEGETREGIRLLSVDLQNGVAHFDNHGQFQNVALCATPDLIARSAAAASAGGVKIRSTPFQNFPSSADGAGTVASGGQTESQLAGFGFGGGSASPQKSASGSGSASSASTASGVSDSSSGTGTDSSSSSSSSGSDSSSVSTSVSDGSTAAADSIANSWWYRASQETEATRVATADAVLQGAASPYPLTPLTPSGTDSQLVSTNSVYFNHFQRQF